MNRAQQHRTKIMLVISTVLAVHTLIACASLNAVNFTHLNKLQKISLLTQSGPRNNGFCIDAPELKAEDLQSTWTRVVKVRSTTGLYRAISELTDDTLVLLDPGVYQLWSTLSIRKNNVSLVGNSARCDEVILLGMGMENRQGKGLVPHAIYSDAAGLTLANLTISEFYHHGVSLGEGARDLRLYNIMISDTGQQLVKANAVTDRRQSIDNGVIEYSVFRYTTTTPRTDSGGGTGYTNAIDVHSGRNWRISNNRFENFHTEDDMDHLWNPAILMWNGASGTIVENNIFVDVDRAIAFGLVDRENDHSGGIIRNNMITLRPNLMSPARVRESDAAILVWSSPDTYVLNNTILTQGNLNKSIELRFKSKNVVVANNLVDSPISDRGGETYTHFGNRFVASSDMFVDPEVGNLRLKRPIVYGITNASRVLYDALFDIDGVRRDINSLSDIGAHEVSQTK